MDDDFGDFFQKEAEINAIRHNIINLIILLDTSGSMHGNRINEVNNVMNGLNDLIKDVEESYCVQVRLRVIQFNSYATWVVGSVEHYIGSYPFWYDHAVESQAWIPLIAGGTTETAEAIVLASATIHNDFYPQNDSRNEYDCLCYHSPIVLLVTDGMSNNPNLTEKAIENLKQAVPKQYEDQITRVSIGIGGASLDELKDFASVGKIERGDGNVSEKTPLAFYFRDDEAILGKNLRDIILSAIVSSIGYGRLSERYENEEYFPVISEYHHDGDEWLD